MNLKLELRSVRKLLFSLWGKYVVYEGKQGVLCARGGGDRINYQRIFWPYLFTIFVLITPIHETRVPIVLCRNSILGSVATVARLSKNAHKPYRPLTLISPSGGESVCTVTKRGGKSLDCA